MLGYTYTVMDNSDACREVPSHLFAFVDTFVDFCVSGGLFLLPPVHTPFTTMLPSPDRLVAIGDLHGDLDKSKQAFRLAGLIDLSDRWIGGNTTVVQVGDVLDRGGDEIKVLYFLEKLKREASRCGGSVISMLGNHEIMNVEGDFRLLTLDGINEFKAWADWFQIGNNIKTLCDESFSGKDIYRGIPSSFNGVNKQFLETFRARVAALRPGGPISTRFLSNKPTVVVVGDSVFVHGGLLEEHVTYGLERINEEVRDWMNGLTGWKSPNFVRGRDSVVWLRKFSDYRGVCDCSTLQHVLATIPGAKRMIMGHTIQKMGINGACDNQAIRIDVGMSKGCGDRFPQVLEILGNSKLRVLTARPLLNPDYKKSKHKEGLGMLIPDQGPKPLQVQA